MAKTNIIFNDKNYSIDESSLSAATTELRNHLQTVMNGSGATINFGGTAYGVDSTKLSAATNAFVAHLGTIAGSGKKVVVNGVEYSIDSAKINNAITYFSDILGNLSSSDDTSDEVINYKSETVVLDENSTSLTIGTISKYGYVENRRCYFYDSDCLVVTLNDFELIIDKTIFVLETGSIGIQTNVVIGQYNGINILCTVKKDTRTGFMPMTISLSEAPTEPISANLTYKTIVNT